MNIKWRSYLLWLDHLILRIFCPLLLAWCLPFLTPQHHAKAPHVESVYLVFVVSFFSATLCLLFGIF